MAPVLGYLSIGGVPVPVYGYGVMLATALFVGGLWVLLAARRAGFELDAVLACLGAALLGGFVGAHGLFVGVEVLHGVPLATTVGGGGIVFYGGLLGGVVGYGLALRLFGLPVMTLLDIGAPALCVGHALGRVGCLLAGCCYGKPFDGLLSVAFVDAHSVVSDGVARHPVQLYEAGFLAALAVVLCRIQCPAGGVPGRRLWTYAGGYALFRFGVEFLRGDLDRGVYLSMGVSTSQCIAAAVLCGVAAVAFASRRGRCTPEPCERC